MSDVDNGPSARLASLEQGDAWMTTDEVAEEWSRNVETIRRWIRDGHLPATRTPGGRTLMVKRSDVIRAFDEGRQVGRPRKAPRDSDTLDVPGDRTTLTQ